MLGYIKGLLDAKTHIVLFQSNNGSNYAMCEDSANLDELYWFWVKRGYIMKCVPLPE